MYQIISKTGLVIEEYKNKKTANAYLKQALKKGSPKEWLTIQKVGGKNG